MDIINIFTYHKNVKELFDKFIETFNFKIDNRYDHIIFTSQNLKIRFQLNVGLDMGIDYYISYTDKNKETKYIYNEIFWKDFERTTKFWYMHGEKRNFEAFYKVYCNSSWSYYSLLDFIYLITSDKISNLIENRYFFDKKGCFDFGDVYKDKYFLDHIFNEYKRYTWEEYEQKSF